MSRIVIACPGASRTGGPEALHQLAHALAEDGRHEVSLIYTGPCRTDVIAAYQTMYPCPHGIDFGVVRDAILVLPESDDPREWRQYGPACVWSWFLSETARHDIAAYLGCGILCQSSWTKAMFTPHDGVLADVRLLTDYIQPRSQLGPSRKKYAVMATNGVRNAVVASLLVRNHGAELYLIAGMDPDQVDAALDRADVYLDVGWHPGKDRGPREAALRGCVVITGPWGTAGGEDVPIPAQHKLTDLHPSLIEALVDEIRRNRQYHQDLQRPYVSWIMGERERFRAEVRHFADQPMVGKGLGIPHAALGLLNAFRTSANQRLEQLVRLNLAARGDFLPDDMTIAARLIMPPVRGASWLLNRFRRWAHRR